jgi:hypothetical protein
VTALALLAPGKAQYSVACAGDPIRFVTYHLLLSTFLDDPVLEDEDLHHFSSQLRRKINVADRLSGRRHRVLLQDKDPIQSAAGLPEKSIDALFPAVCATLYGEARGASADEHPSWHIACATMLFNAGAVPGIAMLHCASQQCRPGAPRVAHTLAAQKTAKRLLVVTVLLTRVLGERA